MKKKLIIISLIIFIAVIIVIIFSINTINNNYTIKATKIDNNSPDRVLVVLKDNEKIEFDSIYYLDDVFVCDSNNPTVGKSAIENGEKLKVKLKNKKVVKAVIEEE